MMEGMSWNAAMKAAEPMVEATKIALEGRTVPGAEISIAPYPMMVTDDSEDGDATSFIPTVGIGWKTIIDGKQYGSVLTLTEALPGTNEAVEHILTTISEGIERTKAVICSVGGEAA